MKPDFKDMIFRASIMSDRSLVHFSLNFKQAVFLSFWNMKNWFVPIFLPIASSLRICSVFIIDPILT